MILFTNKCGQLGNRLFAFGHLIAHGEAQRVTIVNPSFDEYAKYFQTTNNDFFCRYPAAKTIIKSNRLRSWFFTAIKAVLKALRTLNIQNSFLHTIVIADIPQYQFGDERHYDLSNAAFVLKSKMYPFTFIFGRFFRDYKNFDKYQDLIRDYFRPLPSLVADVDDYMIRARRGTDTIVGVHVRRGDYNEFVDGKYFYSESQYASKMKELLKVILEDSGKRTRFIICSNEKIRTENFDGLDFLIAPGHVIKDMYALSRCDLIMGPPSTYSMWASFYGNKPLYQIRELYRSIRLHDFVILSPQRFYNFSFN